MEGSQGVQYTRWEGGRWRTVDGAVIQEALVRLHVNGRELARLMCTPQELDYLALGFLRSEGMIAGRDDVRLLKVCPSQACVDVWLRQADFEAPTQVTITSGCGGGITFADLSEAIEPLVSNMRVGAQQLSALMGSLGETTHLYRESRGVHAAGLARGDALVAVAEDVGRHNAIDKLWGRCLAEDIPTQDAILLTTGRISSEMLRKAARMGTPIIASRTSPTHLSVALAAAWNLTLAGYVRRDSLNVYTGGQRLYVSEGEERIYAHA